MFAQRPGQEGGGGAGRRRKGGRANSRLPPSRRGIGIGRRLGCSFPSRDRTSLELHSLFDPAVREVAKAL
eukprot:9018782-Alexandrium_andersonii.AAC.1